MIIVAPVGPLTRFRKLVLSRILGIIYPPCIVSVNVHRNLIEPVVLDVPEQSFHSIAEAAILYQSQL